MKIYYAEITPLYNKEAFHDYLEKLPDSFRCKIKNINNKEKAVASLGAYTLLSMALKKVGGSDEVQLSYTQNGKPFIKGADICFNLSHSKDYAVCVVDEREVGIDIEKVRKVKEGIAERFFAAAEQEEIEKMVCCGCESAFISAWVLKESLIKAKSGTIVSDLAKAEIKRTNEKNIFTTQNGKYTLKLFADEIPDYKMAVCGMAGKTIYSIEKIEL